MGVASLSSESVPTRTLTPQEPLVETLRVALSKDVILVLTNPRDKTFLVTWLVKEWAWNVRNNVGSILFLVANQKQVDLWKQFFQRTTGNEFNQLKTLYLYLLMMYRCSSSTINNFVFFYFRPPNLFRE